MTPRGVMGLVLMAALLTAACSDETSSGGGGGGGGSSTASCPAGQWQREDGTCVPAGLPPDMPCPPGEWLDEGGTCIPAGVPPGGCGEGFVHDADRGCEPILPADPCPPGQMAVPGDTACHEVAPCGTGTWGDIPVQPDTEHVDGSYTGGNSDGSAAKPWTTIGEAVSAAAPGAIVAIAAGSYLEDVAIVGKPVRLWGRCPAMTEIAGTGGELGAIFIKGGASGSELHALAITGGAVGVLLIGSLDVVSSQLWVHDADGPGVDVEDAYGPTSLALRASLVEQSRDIGVFVQGSQVSIEATVVRDTQPDGNGNFGRGIGVQPDPTTGAPASLTLRASLVEQSHEMGVFVAGSQASIEATVVRNTQPNGQGLGGRGINVQANPATGAPASLTLRASLLEQSHDMGVFVAGSQASIESSVVRDTLPDGQGSFGRGIDVQPDPNTGAPASLTLRASLVEQSHEMGLFVEGSTASIEATVVRETKPNGQGNLGRGINVDLDPTTGAPASLTLRDSLVEQSPEVGVYVRASEASIGATVVEQNHELGVFVEGSTATIEQSAVRNTQTDWQGNLGWGIGVQPDSTTGAPSSLTLRASLVEQSHEIGVFVLGSTATIEQSVVRDTLPDGQGKHGRGINVQPNAATGAPSSLTLRSSLVEQSHEIGVLVGSSTATIEQSIVRDTVANHGLFGDGVMVWSLYGPASATITATRVEQSERAAISSFGAQVGVRSSLLACQSFDLDGEPYHDLNFSLDDLGGNLCGCPDANSTCAVVSSSLEPPPPVGGIE